MNAPLLPLCSYASSKWAATNIALFRRRRGRHRDRSDRYDDVCRAACSDALPTESYELIVTSRRSEISLANRASVFARASSFPDVRVYNGLETPIILRADRVAFSGLKRADGHDYDRLATFPSYARRVKHLIVHLTVNWKRNARRRSDFISTNGQISSQFQNSRFRNPSVFSERNIRAISRCYKSTFFLILFFSSH